MDTASVKSLYIQAADAIHAATELSIRIETTKSMIMGQQTFTEISQQKLDMLGRGTDAVTASMEETLSIGPSTIKVTELYQDGTAYFTINGNDFSGAMTAEEYCGRYTPAAPFNADLYADAQMTTVSEGTSITFSQATAAEDWAVPDGAQWVDSSGYAVISPDGQLSGCTYSIQYTIGQVSVSQTTKITIDSVASVSVLSPAPADTYTPLEYLDAPRKLEQASGYLLQTTQIQATTNRNITCQAFAINRDQSTVLTMSGSGDSFLAQVDVNVHQINQSKGGEVTQIQQTERFENGIYTLSSNGSAPTENQSVSADSMQEYCRNVLVSTLLLPEYITGATVTETDTTYRISFTASQALAESICSDVCNTLYGDPNLLDTLASSYNTETIQCYLELDKLSGLPVASGLQHSTTHTIEDISYSLTSQTDQTYCYE